MRQYEGSRRGQTSAKTFEACVSKLSVLRQSISNRDDLLPFRFGMLITNLNVINVFTDEFDQIKAEGKSLLGSTQPD